MSTTEIDMTEFVDKFYEMDPETDELLTSGYQLENGMVVLVEAAINREDLSRVVDEPYALDRAKTANRWCMVSELRYEPYGDRRTSVVVKFVGIYPNGSKRMRSYHYSFGWLVKKDSMRGAE